MTSPYRSLPVLPAARPVCAWCRHAVRPEWSGDVPKCNALRERVPCPVRGSKIVNERRDCFVVNGRGECIDFEPSLVTRIARALGVRR